ncbi:MAG: cell division protein FtsW [Eubacterium sp.]|nr:cell division protein FtsW [Eubacterium sp.]
MADRFPPIDPPMRYPRRTPEPDDNAFNREGRRQEASEKVVKSRKTFHLARLSDFFITGEFDIVFFALTMLLLAIGLVMLLSASYPTAYYQSDNSYSYFIKQLIFAVVGFVAMIVASKLDYKIYKDLLKIMLPVSMLLLVVVLFYNNGKTSGNGEKFRRYIPLFSGVTFQPSEVAKFVLIVTLAVFFSKFAGKIKTFKYGIFFPLAIIAVFCGLIVLENHVSCTILMFLIGASIMFAGGSNKWLFWLGVIVVAAAVIVVFMFPDMLPQYVQDKLMAFTDKDFEPLKGRWQINNSLYAIGSGGFFGVGLGNSKQKYMYVSEPQNDFIFSIVCEELGFIGAIIIIILFVLLVLRGIQISMKARDKFGSYIALGITAQIGIQTVFNILVVTDAIPNTGIALPFFSYGGTALVMLLFEAGVVLSISRKANQRKI